jgi:hypothetical protein
MQGKIHRFFRKDAETGGLTNSTWEPLLRDCLPDCSALQTKDIIVKLVQRTLRNRSILQRSALRLV